MLSEILPTLFSCHQEFLLDTLRRRSFGHEGELEVSDNLVDNFMIFYESDDLHLTSIKQLWSDITEITIVGGEIVYQSVT